MNVLRCVPGSRYIIRRCEKRQRARCYVFAYCWLTRKGVWDKLAGFVRYKTRRKTGGGGGGRDLVVFSINHRYTFFRGDGKRDCRSLLLPLVFHIVFCFARGGETGLGGAWRAAVRAPPLSLLPSLLFYLFFFALICFVFTTWKGETYYKNKLEKRPRLRW